MGADAKHPSDSNLLKSDSHSEFGSKLWTGGFRVTDSVSYVKQVEQAGGSCDTHGVCDVSREESDTVNDSKVKFSVKDRMKNIMMVGRLKLQCSEEKKV